MSSLASALSANKINENKVRLIAFWTFLTALAYIAVQGPVIPILLVVDFGLRAFDLGRYSPFARLSDLALQQLNWGVKPIFYPPKRFAARIGLALSIVILGTQLTGSALGIGAAGILAFFAALESFFGICAGCYVYNWLAPVWQKLSGE